MDLRSLKYFVHVADVGSITVAAQDLGIVQPALTRHIQRLEDDVNAKLLVRLPRGVRLTRAGRVYLERCRRILSELEFAKEEVSLERTPPNESLALAVPGSLVATLVPELMRRMCKAFPRARLLVHEGRSADTYKQILDGTLDLAIIADPPVSHSVHLEVLASEPFVVVGAAQSGAGRKFYTADALSKLKFIMPGPFLMTLDHQLSRSGKRVNVEHEVNSIEAIRRLLLAGMGQTIVPISAFRDDLEAGRLKAWPVVDVDLKRGLSLAHRLDISASGREAAKLIRAYILELAACNYFAAPPVEKRGRN